MKYDTGLSEVTRKNLENIVKEIEEENVDWPIALEGTEGSGKSALAQAIGLEVDGGKFNVEEQIAFSGENFQEKMKSLGEEQKVVIYDEGVDDLMATDTMTSAARERVKFLRRCRELNKIPILIMPVFVEMNSKIQNNRVKTLGRCIKEGQPGNRRRYVLWYGEKTLQEIEEDSNDEIQYPEASASDTWNDPEKEWPEIWEEYIDRKEGDIREEGENEEDEISVPEIVRIVKKRPEEYTDTYGERKYIKRELIEYDFDVGESKGRKVKAVVERDLGLNQD